jgi:hypothetical protein
MGILDSLIRRIEGSGGKAIVTSGSPHRTVITLDGVNLEIQMREGWNQVPHEQTPKDKRFIMNHEYWKVPKWDYTPSGDLLLEVMDYLGTGVRHRWRDGKRRLLSEKPERVLDGLRKAAAALKAVEEERERWQREREERLRKEDEARVQREEEQRRIENLKQLTTNWELARRIREFVTAARQGLVDHHGVLEEGSPLDNWLRRAQGIADRLDPTPEAFRELSPRRLETEAVATLPPLATPPSSSPP